MHKQQMHRTTMDTLGRMSKSFAPRALAGLFCRSGGSRITGACCYDFADRCWVGILTSECLNFRHFGSLAILSSRAAAGSGVGEDPGLAGLEGSGFKRGG